MVRGVLHRLFRRGALVTAVVLSVGLLPVAAAAAPTRSVPAAGKPLAAAPAAKAKPDAVTITGDGLTDRLVVRAQDDPELFRELLGQVSWLANAVPHTGAPKSGKAGRKYTVVVLARNAPQQTYDLYPLATGGPRAFRPAKQPTGGKKTAGWFYGRLTMSETLRLAGVPLPEKPDVVSGGIGGGQRIEAPEPLEPGKDLEQFLAEMRRLMLLNGAVVLVIALGLAGMSYLVRRKV